MTAPMHPEITVKLVGGDGNAFAIIGSVVRAMRAAKLPEDEIKQFRDEAMSGDYDRLLQTCIKWVEVE
jgi:hypothetical protein